MSHGLSSPVSTDCTLGVHEVLDSHVKSGVLERCSSAYRGFDEVTADTHFELGIIIYIIRLHKRHDH